MLSAVPKILDRIVSQFLYSKLSPSIDSRQHGFFHRRSAITSLTSFTNYIFNVFNSCGGRRQVDTAYIDFAKAFDKVQHHILLAKLEIYGVNGNLLTWFANYIQNRVYKVAIKDKLSSEIIAASGVPQGSHLGPFLFLIYIKFIYLDLSRLQRDISRMEIWSERNGLTISHSKSNIISFFHGSDPFIFDYEICNKTLVRCSEIRDLGIILDSALSFQPHLQHVTTRASRLVGFISRTTTDFRNPESLISLYKALVLSVLHYGSVIWSPYTMINISILESVQRRFLRILCSRFKFNFNFFSHDYSQCSKLFNLPTIKSLHNFDDAIFEVKIRTGAVDCGDIGEYFVSRSMHYSIRLANPLVEPLPVYDYVKYSPVHRLIRSYNIFNSLILNSSSFIECEAALRDVILRYYLPND